MFRTFCFVFDKSVLFIDGMKGIHIHEKANKKAPIRGKRLYKNLILFEGGRTLNPNSTLEEQSALKPVQKTFYAIKVSMIHSPPNDLH